MEPPNIRQTLKIIEKLIREGKASAARLELQKLTRNKLPRSELRHTARLARRADFPMFGIRILNPLVRPAERRPVEASDGEKAEYAACLTQVGAIEEALDLLGTLKPKELPEVHLFQAYALMARWDYRETIPYLLDYVGNSKVDEYFRTVGKVNLAAAYIFERDFGRALPLLETLLMETGQGPMKLLYGNSLELAAQAALFQRRWIDAGRFLSEAETVLNEVGTRDSLFVRKWRCILELATHGKTKIYQVFAKGIREDAEKIEHWETHRTLDRFEAVILNNRELLTHLYFGTPFSSFRNRLMSEFHQRIEMPARYSWRLQSAKPIGWLDISSGVASCGKEVVQLKNWQALHHLLSVLSSDFYRPFRLASLHFRLYPDEYFNPLTSPARVRQVIIRLRDWFEQNRIPLRVEERRGAYRLVAKAPYEVRVPQAILESRTADPLALLSAHFNSSTFSAKQASDVLKMPPRTANRLLKEACEDDVLDLVGRGRATKYRIRRS